MYREGKKCVIYVRVSTEMQVDGYSLDGQKNMLNKYAEREGLIVLNTYEDAGKSGKSIEGRPAFKQMIFDIEHGLHIDYILVYKLSRFGRNAADILNSLELIQDYDVNLLSVNEGLDSGQSTGKILISILSTMAEMERENIIEQTMNGRREKARQGGWNGGFAPYGYKLVNGKFEIVPEEADVVMQIYDLYCNKNYGIEKIARELNYKGIKKNIRYNGSLDRWTRGIIVTILENPIYTGKMAYGRRKREKVKGTKNTYRKITSNDFIISDGEHTPIISYELYDIAQSKRLETKKKYFRCHVGKDRVHLLSGILKCPKCGGPMYASASHNRNGTQHFAYECSYHKSQRRHTCDCNIRLPKEKIEPYVIEFIKRILKDSNYIDLINSHIVDSNDTQLLEMEKKEFESKLKQLTESKKKLEYEIDNMPLDVKHRDDKLKDKNDRLDSIYDIIDELKTKINGINVRLASSKTGKTTKDTISEILYLFDELFEKMEPEEQKSAVSGLISKITIKENPMNYNYIDEITLTFNPNDERYIPITLPGTILDDVCLYIENEKYAENEKTKEPKVTYKMIMEYVANKYGYKICSNNIAEVKRMHGIDIQNGNDDLKVYSCSPKRIAAIEEALTYYKVI